MRWNEGVTDVAYPLEDILAQICCENLAVYRESAGRLQEDVSQESQVAHDYRGRLVYELLQNADDALVGMPTAEDRALFRLTDTELWVANTGRTFTDADVRGLCGLGASSKAQSDGPRRASIGHKGLGFKSVLEITESPEAYSEALCFRLGREHALSEVGTLWEELGRGAVRGVPAMRFPAPINEQDPTWLELMEAGYTAAFRFPFRDGIDSGVRAGLAQQLLTLPMTSVLFLKHLEQVVIDVSTSDQKAKRQWVLERHHVINGRMEPCDGLTVSGLYKVDLIDDGDINDCYWVAHNDDLRIGANRDGLNGPAWEGVDFTEVSTAVRDVGSPQLDPVDRRFHVFLPTAELLGCSILVNGAFTTDLSRQRLQISSAPTDYNGHLVRKAAGLFVEVLLPHMLGLEGPTYVLEVLRRDETGISTTGELFAVALAEALSAAPLLPSGASELTLAQAVVPTPILDSSGSEFASLLKPGSGVDGRQFPDPAFCQGSLAAVCADYGATALSPVETLRALARNVDPQKAAFTVGADPRFRIDPVLDLCALLWERSGASDRQALEAIARDEPVFPIGENEDGTVKRIVVGQDIAFYPPRSSSEELPLRKLRFLAHGVCWGSLGRAEQRSALERRMKAWDSLFDIKEFRFEEVMRAAVLPGLSGKDSDLELRASNRTVTALAAICRLAGKTTKPDQPLPLGRLGSDRAFFNLARLEVPCRRDATGELTWAPAHRVYFGRDWVGDDSIEPIFDAVADAGETVQVDFLAPPEEFAQFASAIGVSEDADTSEARDTSADDGEVDLDDDTDEALETTSHDRWHNFFAWLGVSRGLRLVPFRDVDDAGSGWTNTKGLGLPAGWSFVGRDEVWSDYVKDLVGPLASDPRWAQTDHYLYQVHNLDLFDEISRVVHKADNRVAETLMDHLIRNWRIYERRTRAQLALVGADKSPAKRTSPPRALSEEIVSAGPDFWLHRLRRASICTTSHGPRRPDQTWRRSEELERRLGRSGRNADAYLPVLHLPTGTSSHGVRACLDDLQVRGELTPAAFTTNDAKDLCERISEIHSHGIEDKVLRSEVRPIYRQLFELLVGDESAGTPLADAPLAARTTRGYGFLPANQVVYASTSGSRERSGIQDKVPLFVLEAESSALRPLRDLFGTPLLEQALEWDVNPGESALQDAELEDFREGLRDLIAPLLARLNAERADKSGADKKALTEFAQRLEPVVSLDVTCSFRGEDLGPLRPRTYFVRRTPGNQFQGFVLWTGPAWPPAPEDAQSLSMALAETLEVNTVETFLSFIRATHDQRRELLDLAGASDKLEEIEDELAEGKSDPVDLPPSEEIAESPGLTDGDPSQAGTSHPADTEATTQSAAPRVPLFDFDDLLMDGEIIRVEGATTPAQSATQSPPTMGGHGSRAPGVHGPTAPRAATGTNLTEMDRLGMSVTFAFEQRRFPGEPSAVLPGDEPCEDVAVLVVDVSSPQMISAAERQSTVVKKVLNELAKDGISELYPGFDVLTIHNGEVDRMIELKSSGVDAKTQSMSWNEWKTAKGERRSHFWLYLVGNLRSDLGHAPFLRAVQDPFGTLAATESEDVIRKRTIQLRVREFPAADELTLGIRKAKSHEAGREVSPVTRSMDATS